MLIHNTIRKYTLAMLETFNGLKVEYPVNVNGTTEYHLRNIPIKYSSREKLNLLDEVSEQNLLSGNYNVLPRTSITMSTIVRNLERQSNKFTKLATTDFGDFLFNAVAYDFTFDMTIMCRGMNEASSITEQITSRFNPNYTLLINEIPNQKIPTSVPISLLDVGITTQEYEEISTNIITLTVGFLLKGNFYSPIMTTGKIKNVDMFINLWHTSSKNEYNRAKLYEYDVVDNIVQPDFDEYTLTVEGQFGKIIPEITDILCNDSVSVGSLLKAQCIYNDYDNKLAELEFTWSCSGSTEIIGEGHIIELIGRSTEIVELKCIIMDPHGNTSNMFIKQITIL